jgi:hypothetical protein
MPASNLWLLSQSWYMGRLSFDWKPRPRNQAQQLLSEAGFVGPFWSLPE